MNPDDPAIPFKLYLISFLIISISGKLSPVFEMNVNIFSLFLFASFVYPVAPEDGTGAPLRETSLASVYPGKARFMPLDKSVDENEGLVSVCH